VIPPGRDLPALSIVVPSLNQGAYLDRAITSLVEQRYPRLEIIVMDGGSQDQTRDVLARHRASLAHVVSAADDGPAAALNAGFRFATGEVLGFLNADDFLLPDSLKTVGEFFNCEPDTDVVSGHGYFAMPDGTLSIPAYSDPWDPVWFRYGACVLLQPATFFRRRAFDRTSGFRQSGRVCWDMELWADLARTGAVFRTMEARLAAFRIHDASLTGRADLRTRRRADARAVAAEFGGSRDSASDRGRHYWYRARKFLRHPARALRQRWFFRSVAGRWSV
jgi:glycosyltransferase involved in cell wall biosynthesis